MKEQMKDRILRIIFLPLAIIALGFWLSVACVLCLLVLPFAFYQELADREGSRRRKELWGRLKNCVED